MTSLRRHLRPEVLVRVAADALIVNLAYLQALVLRLLWDLVVDGEIVPRSNVLRSLRVFGDTFWLLTAITVAVYTMAGLYTRSRFYRGRFKMLAIAQAVSLAHVLFGFALYLALARGWLLQPKRSVLIVSWVLTLTAAVGARWCAALWRRMLKREAPQLRQEARGRHVHHVLVIGGGGYIGSVLCRRLLHQGYSVRVLDKLFYGQQSLAELTGHPRFELLEGDSRDVSAVCRAMTDMDAVVHLGELVGDPACALDEKLTVEINVAATRMVAEAARGCGVKRFVYASSCSVYGAGADILTERSALQPLSLYARAKIASEKMLLSVNGPDFHPVILRFATVYGLSPRPRFDLVVNLLTAKAVREGEITVMGGDQWRPFVHVADIAQAIMLCLAAPLAKVKGQVYNVGSDEQNYTINDLGALIQRLIPDSKLVTRETDVDRRDYRVSFTRIHRELGFRPSRTVEDGVLELAEALRTGVVGNYQDRRHSNYKTLSDPGNLLSIRSRHIIDLYTPAAAAEPEETVPVPTPAPTVAVNGSAHGSANGSKAR